MMIPIRRFGHCRRAATLLLSVGGALTLPAYGTAQERHTVWAEPAAHSGSILLAAPRPETPVAPTTSAVRRAFLSDTGRAGMYIGLALGAQIGAVQALTSCQRRREGQCLENHLPSEIAFTVGSGAIGAVIGTLIHRRREAAGEEPSP